MVVVYTFFLLLFLLLPFTFACLYSDRVIYRQTSANARGNARAEELRFTSVLRAKRIARGNVRAPVSSAFGFIPFFLPFFFFLVVLLRGDALGTTIGLARNFADISRPALTGPLHDRRIDSHTVDQPARLHLWSGDICAQVNLLRAIATHHQRAGVLSRAHKNRAGQTARDYTSRPRDCEIPRCRLSPPAQLLVTNGRSASYTIKCGSIFA